MCSGRSISQLPLVIHVSVYIYIYMYLCAYLYRRSKHNIRVSPTIVATGVGPYVERRLAHLAWLRRVAEAAASAMSYAV